MQLYLFHSSKKHPNTYKDADQEPDKIPISKKKLKVNKVISVMNPPGTLFLKDILRLKDKCNINNPHLTHMKGNRNAKGASLCLPFLISGKCDSTDPF